MGQTICQTNLLAARPLKHTHVAPVATIYHGEAILSARPLCLGLASALKVEQQQQRWPSARLRAAELHLTASGRAALNWAAQRSAATALGQSIERIVAR